MAKRKQEEDNDSDNDSGSDVSMVNVDFDFCNLHPTVDYQAIKRLLGQLFQQDAEGFNTHEFTELILSQSGMGTTVKTDGEESDPLALLTVLNMHVHQNHESIKAVADYAIKKAASNPSFQATLQTLFSQSDNNVGLLICERLINMPVQLIPPMYTSIGQEIQQAIQENRPFKFSHVLVFSRTYHLSTEEETVLSTRQNRQPSSKSKKAKKASQEPTTTTRPEDGIYSFHPEDEAIMKAATFTVTYPFSSAPREKDAFGLDLRGRMMLVPIQNFEGLVAKMNEVYSAT